MVKEGHVLETVEVVHKTDPKRRMIINLQEFNDNPGKYKLWKDRDSISVNPNFDPDILLNKGKLYNDVFEKENLEEDIIPGKKTRKKRRKKVEIEPEENELTETAGETSEEIQSAETETDEQ